MSIKLIQNTKNKIKYKFVMRGNGRALRINLAIEGFKRILIFDNFNIYSESGHRENFNLKKSKFDVKDAMVIL